jgi:hypothetical protein
MFSQHTKDFVVLATFTATAEQQPIFKHANVFNFSPEAFFKSYSHITAY